MPIKHLILHAVLIFTALTTFAQKKYFEGDLTYHVTIKSKSETLSDKDAYKVLAAGATLTVSYKNGNYKQHSEYSDGYVILKDKKQYVKFKNIDTLYYVDYAFDTSAVLDIIKDPGSYKITNYDCKALTIKGTNSTKKYFYSPSLLLNPEYDKDNTIGKYNIYSRESGGAIYLLTETDFSFARQTDSCTKVDPKPIDDHTFDLPALPIKEFNAPSLIHDARFRGKEGAWLKYLQSSLDAKLALKYLKLPKGKQEASEQVIVEFIVTPDGTISNPHVLNEKEVHSQLAKEAIRVITESPKWEPCTFYGQKISSVTRQPVVFKIQAQ